MEAELLGAEQVRLRIEEHEECFVARERSELVTGEKLHTKHTGLSRGLHTGAERLVRERGDRRRSGGSGLRDRSGDGRRLCDDRRKRDGRSDRRLLRAAEHAVQRGETSQLPPLVEELEMRFTRTRGALQRYASLDRG